MKEGNCKSNIPPNLIRAAWDGFRPYILRELQILKSYLPASEQLPATGVLHRAYVTLLESEIAAIDDAPENWNEIAKQFEHDWLELRSWVYSGVLKEKDEFQPSEIARKVNILETVGFSDEQIRDFLNPPPRPPRRGAPPSRHAPRCEKLLACDLWLLGASYRGIAEYLCDCGAKQHTGCAQKYRKRIKEVCKLLKQYGTAESPLRRPYRPFADA